MGVAEPKLMVTVEIISNFLTMTFGGLVGAQGFRVIGDTKWNLIGVGLLASVVGSMISVRGLSANITKESMRLGRHGTVLHLQIDGVSPRSDDRSDDRAD